MKKKLCLALSGALCLSAGVGCGTETAEETLTPVRLNEVVHSVFYAPQYVAQELGFFEEEGLDVSVAVGNGADKSMTALLPIPRILPCLAQRQVCMSMPKGRQITPKPSPS